MLRRLLGMASASSSAPAAAPPNLGVRKRGSRAGGGVVKVRLTLALHPVALPSAQRSRHAELKAGRQDGE
jgi:hypothetical protein